MRALKQKIATKTDNELMYYIKNVDKHTEEAVRLEKECCGGSECSTIYPLRPKVQ